MVIRHTREGGKGHLGGGSPGVIGIVQDHLNIEEPSDLYEEEKGQWVCDGEATVPDVGRVRENGWGGFQSWNSAIRVEIRERMES